MLSWAFFLPGLLSNHLLSGFWCYVIAHGAQYLIFVSVASYQGNCRAFAGAWALFGIMFALLAVAVSTPLGGKILYGAGMAHFLIDAKLWRLREPVQRALIRERFAFLLPAAARPGP